MNEAPQFLDHSKDLTQDIGSVLRTGELRCGAVDHIESDIKSTPSRLTFSFPHEKQQKTVMQSTVHEQTFETAVKISSKAWDMGFLRE